MTRLGEKVPVDLLEPPRLERVEQRVLGAVKAGETEDRQRRRPPGWRWAVPAVAVGIAAVAVWWLASGAPAGSGAPAPIALETGPSQVTLSIGDARVAVGANASIAVTRQPDGGALLQLSRGRVDCDVEPRAGRAPFVVDAGVVNVVVVGTVFAVERDGDEVQVEVSRGSVQVSGPDGERRVAAGHRWQRSQVVAIAAGARADTLPPPAVEDEPASAAHQAPVADTVTREQPPEPPPPPAGDVPGQTPNAPTVDRYVAPPAETGRDDSQGDAHGAAPRRSGRPGKAAAHPRPQGGEDGPVMPGSRPRRWEPPEGSAELVAVATLEVEDPGAAAKAFRRISYRQTGPHASYAMYSLAYLQLYSLGRRAAAAQTASQYHRRFPRGREAQSARWLRVLALCSIGRMDDCRAAAHFYLDRHPAGRHAAAARRVVNR